MEETKPRTTRLKTSRQWARDRSRALKLCKLYGDYVWPFVMGAQGFQKFRSYLRILSARRAIDITRHRTKFSRPGGFHAVFVYGCHLFTHFRTAPNSTCSNCAEFIASNKLTLWRRNYFFFNFSTPVYKMWIIQEPNTLALWNKLHFEEKKNGEYRACLKYSVSIFVE